MKCIAASDRLFRVIMGLVILGLGVYFQSWWGVVGMMPLLVGAIGRCPNLGGSTHRLYLDREGLDAKAGRKEAARSRAE